MSTIFLSHSYSDLETARALEDRLQNKGYRFRIPAGTAVTGNWRSKYTKALAGADVHVILVTEAALKSQKVLGEIGAGRVLEHLRGMLLLPVLVGGIDIPDLIDDIYCFRLKNDPDALVEELHKAILDNVKLSPRIFVSHHHTDEPIAAALTRLLEQAFHVDRNDIRCTSVQRYMLTPGERTSEQLRAEIARAELVIGILCPDTPQSNYVLCELGAAWGRDAPTFPVLARGATFADVPPPLNERHSISLQSKDNCLQLVEYVASKTSFKRRERASEKVEQQARLLAKAASVR